MSSTAKLCVVVFDEMAIKERLHYDGNRDVIEGTEDLGDLGKTQYVANHAGVFMIRGLVEKWKQSVGYFLTSGPMSSDVLKDCLLTCIEKVQAAGLLVKAVICDQGSNIRSMVTELGVDVDNPIFEVNGEKIHVPFDPRHLLKNIRNNLKKSGFVVDDNDISWEYIEKFYNIDSQLPIRMAPKLTDKHINLPPFMAMRVNLAAQVLSHSVAAGLTTLCMLGNSLPPEAIHTAHFIEKFDSLFNAFNSSSLNAPHKYRRAFSITSGHQEFLSECLKWLSEVKHNGKHSSLPCLEGWKLSINSLISLWNHLHDDFSLEFLLTNRLNQDCLENFFSMIRGRGGHRDNPDSVQFRAEYRAIAVESLFSCSIESNCKDDSDDHCRHGPVISGVNSSIDVLNHVTLDASSFCIVNP